MTQLPDRSTVGGGGNITKAAAEIFSKVKKDNLAAEARRHARAARAASRDVSGSPAPPAIRPTIEADHEPEEVAESEAQSESTEETSDGEGSEYEDGVQPRTKRATPQKSPQKTARKRAREDAEAEARAEQERKERDARLRRERSAEARKQRNQKLADAQAAARERAEQERQRYEEQRRIDQAAWQESARTAMPPPLPHPAAPLVPPEIVMTPASAHIVPGDMSVYRPPSARSFIEEGNLFVEADINTPRPPPPKNSNLGDKLLQTQPADRSDAYRWHWGRIWQTLNPWSVLKLMMGVSVMLHAIRLVHFRARPDLFEAPVLTLNWYGWKDWTSNVGQFFPSPFLQHPIGVLSQKQYDDLKAYLQQRTTTTEAVVDNLKSVIPKVVSVRKDKSGKILIADEFWNALKERIQKDDSILSLDGKSRISEQHWKAIQQRLKDAGLLAKPLSADDVSRIVDNSAPKSWENWLQKNERKVAEMLRQTLGKDAPKGTKGGDETVVSRREFIRELTEQLEKNKNDMSTTMDSLRHELYGLVHEVKTTALAGGMSEADIKKLIKEIVDKEVARRYLDTASKTSTASIDAALRRRVNHFSPGNGAQADIALSSPAFRLTAPRIGSKEWLKSLPRQPQFLGEPLHALTPWSDPGHCWCAGTRSHPATLAVRLRAFVVPQYVVLEHIDPGATADPGAMPRDVEVWAVFDEHARRERVLDWMAARFPDAVGHPLLAQGLAKIGQFTYEHRPQDGGVFVHKLADELLDQLGAATDLVMVRAVTNYGSEDHTCFYRVRLYGEPVELEAESKSKQW
ncbi:2654d632-75fd-4703-9b81-b4387a13ca99 [Thermothielavioides terrestris]|nr:2654d632-75fd-4703-9b81-b4387a13ca99 [Thermothielavioides terrestris]